MGKMKARADTNADSYWEHIKFISVTAVVAMIVRIVLFEAFAIEGRSMEPTLLDGERVVVSKIAYGLFLPLVDEAIVNWSTPTPGSVVIVKSPADNIDIVKRVIGKPGDIISIRDNVVYRNGKPIRISEQGPCKDEEGHSRTDGCEWITERVGMHRYHTSQNTASIKDRYSPVRVREGHIYVMGDHRDRSNDSRYFGQVPVNRVKGKAVSIYWSRGKEVRWRRIFSGID